MFKGNRIVRVIRYATTRNSSGGKVAVISAFWNKWADVADRNGFTNVSQQQEVWQYEQRITIRYEPTRPTHSNDLIQYNGGIYKINSIVKSNEATINYEVCYCSKSDQEINNLPPMNIDNIQVFNYYGEGGEYDVQANVLTGKNYFGAFKDGVEFEIIPNDLTASTTPDQNKKQIYIDPGTGETVWSQPFLLNEHGMIQFW